IAIADYYKNNEDGPGGFFPVGPFEPYRLWHGGVHLHAPEGEKVYAPWQGQLVAARNVAQPSAAGSVNFVLLKYAMRVRAQPLEFYVLYHHLRAEPAKVAMDKRLHWTTNEKWTARDPASSRPVVMSQPVQAGEVIGYVGKAGPEDEPQVHFEVFFLDIE